MAYDEELAERVRLQLAGLRNIEEKKMFGGLGFLHRGNMLVGVWKNSMIVRLGPEQAEDALYEPHVRVFDITGKAMKGWVMINPEGVADETNVDVWVKLALNFVTKLPAK